MRSHSRTLRTVNVIALISMALASLAGCVVVVGDKGGDSGQQATPMPSIDFEAMCHTQIADDTNVTGTTVIQHPAWGAITIVVCGKLGGTFETGINYAGVLAVDNTGTVKWLKASRDNHVMCELADPATDASGNIFVLYNPGRNNGVMILRPTADSIEVLADSYSAYMEQTTPLYFYAAGLIGPGSDGLYQIAQSSNNCGLDCAPGIYPYTTYVWNGTTYVEQ